MEIDKIIRQCRVALNLDALPLRSEEDLDAFCDSDVPGERIMLDTCVMIDQLQGSLPKEIEARVLARTVVHSPTVMGELSFLLGRLDPSHPGTAQVISGIRGILDSIPDHRILELKPEDAARGSILAGCMARILGYNKESRRKAQNDAVLAAQAARLGCLLVSRNIADFDRLSQLEPKLRVAFYQLPKA